MVAAMHTLYSLMLLRDGASKTSMTLCMSLLNRTWHMPRTCLEHGKFDMCAPSAVMPPASYRDGLYCTTVKMRLYHLQEDRGAAN